MTTYETVPDTAQRLQDYQAHADFRFNMTMLALLVLVVVKAVIFFLRLKK